MMLFIMFVLLLVNILGGFYGNTKALSWFVSGWISAFIVIDIIEKIR